MKKPRIKPVRNIRKKLMRKRILLDNINRVDDFMRHERYNLNHLPEEFDEATFLYELYRHLNFVFWDISSPLTVFLPFNEYINMLGFAQTQKDWLDGEFKFSGLGRNRDKNKKSVNVTMDKWADGESFSIKTNVVSDVHFIIRKYANKVNLPDWVLHEMGMDNKRNEGHPHATAEPPPQYKNYIGLHTLIFKYVYDYE